MQPHVHADDHLKLQQVLGYHHADIIFTIQRLGKYCRAPAKPAAAKDPTAPAIMAALGPLVDLNRPADTKPGTKNTKHRIKSGIRAQTVLNVSASDAAREQLSTLAHQPGSPPTTACTMLCRANTTRDASAVLTDCK